MTGGQVVILGEVGANFGAGMTVDSHMYWMKRDHSSINAIVN